MSCASYRPVPIALGGLMMQRTTLILMTVLTLAILDGGNVSRGLAESNCVALEISGASGRSVCENNWLARWTWTAPATGPVTFDTQASDFGLLLTVLDLDGTFQDEMSFNAQQGQKYVIFAWRTNNSIDPGTIVLNWRPASSCGTGGAASGETGLREAAFDDPDPGAPAYVLAGPEASVWYWTADDVVTQSLYVSTDGSVSVRTFHDADGLPYKVVNECAGDWMLIRRYDAENVDFWFYDAGGNYQSGLAVFEDEGSYYYAKIDGEPVHAGKQITGSLRPTGASWTGSYALEVDMSEIQDWQPVPDEIATLINGLSSDGTGRSSIAPGWQPRFAALLGPLGTWLLPGVAVAQPVVTVQDVLFWGGIAMVGVGTAGIAAPAYATAGAFTFLASYLAPDVSQETIRSRCPDSPQMAHDLCHMAANNLADPGERGPIGFVSDLARDVRGTLSDVADGSKELLSGIGRFFSSSEPPQAEDEPIRPIPDDAPPETVTGTMTNGTTTVDVAGTVTPDGDVDVENDDGAVQLQLSIGGGASDKGSFEWNGVSGEAEVDAPSGGEVEVGIALTAEDLTNLEEAVRANEEAMRRAEEARRLAEQAGSELDGASELNGDNGAIVGSSGGRPTLIKPLPDLRGPVGSTRTIDLSQHFESTDDGRLTYGTTSNENPDVASARVSGSTLTLQARQTGTTTIRVTAWHFTDGTNIADTMRIHVTGSSDDSSTGTSDERSHSYHSFTAHHPENTVPFAGAVCYEFFVADLKAFEREGTSLTAARAYYEANPGWNVYDGFRCPTGGSGYVREHSWGAVVQFYYGTPGHDEQERVAREVSGWVRDHTSQALTGVVDPDTTARVVPWPPQDDNGSPDDDDSNCSGKGYGCQR